MLLIQKIKDLSFEKYIYSLHGDYEYVYNWALRVENLRPKTIDIIMNLSEYKEIRIKNKSFLTYCKDGFLYKSFKREFYECIEENDLDICKPAFLYITDYSSNSDDSSFRVLSIPHEIKKRINFIPKQIKGLQKLLSKGEITLNKYKI